MISILKKIYKQPDRQTDSAPERKPNSRTELVFILDRSGSMAGLESDTVGGFNSMLEKQRGGEDTVRVTTVLFDHMLEKLHDRVFLPSVEPLTENEYFVRGCTALYDAVGETVTQMERSIRADSPEVVPGKVVCVIITDGLENASKEYTAADIRRLIAQAEKQGWEFVFLGANIDAVTAADNIGIRSDRAVNYHADAEGLCVTYGAIGNFCKEIRSCKKPSAEWRRQVDEDFAAR